MNISKGFDIASSSGDSYLLLRFIKDCSCKDGNPVSYNPLLLTSADVDSKILKEFSDFVDCFENINFSNSVFCDKCFNLGELFKPIKTEPFRRTMVSNVFSNKNILEPDFIFLDNQSYNIYLDEKYSDISFSDLICCVDEKNIITNVFKVIGNEVLKFNEFKYVELTVNKIHHSKLIGIGVFDYVKAAKLY